MYGSKAILFMVILHLLYSYIFALFSEVHCGPAIEIKHSSNSTYGDDKVDGKVTYTCNRGYQRLSGDGFSRCQMNGTWTKPTLICEGDFFIFVREQLYLENSHNIIFTPKHR